MNLDSCLCGLSPVDPPHNSTRTSRPCRLFGGCHQEDNTPLRQDPRLKYHQPLPPFRPHRRMLPRPAKGPLPRTLRLLMPPGCSVNGHFKSIESHLHDGYYTTCSHSSGEFQRNLFLLGFLLVRTVYFGKDF